MEFEKFSGCLKKFRRMTEERGWAIAISAAICYFLNIIGIQIKPFYYLNEMLPSELPHFMTASSEGFEFSVFGSNEMKEISRMPERQGYAGKQAMIDDFNKGEICLGLKHSGEIAAFTWISLERCNAAHHVAAMKPTEAYLHGMYVIEKYRGKNLAPLMRYRTYEMLKGIGRDAFYSITELFNTAAIRFKQKLGAKVVFLGVHVKIFRVLNRTWILRRY